VIVTLIVSRGVLADAAPSAVIPLTLVVAVVPLRVSAILAVFIGCKVGNGTLHVVPVGVVVFAVHVGTIEIADPLNVTTCALALMSVGVNPM
jgi:hypothetical protein